MAKPRAPWGDPRPNRAPPDDAPGIEQLVYKIISEAKTVGQAMVGLERLASWLESLGGDGGQDRKADTSEVRAWIEQVGKRHASFQKFLAPRGWALSPTLQQTGHYIIVARGLELGALTPFQADAGLAVWVLDHGDFDGVLNRFASAPLQGVWRWAWIAGEAMAAMMVGSHALASYGWLVIAEGMWRDIEEHRIGSRPKGFYAKSKKARPKRFGAQLAWSEESLIAAHAVLAEDGRTVVNEPVEQAILNRHGFLHGNVAGIIPAHHAVKAFTIVDAMLELAEAYVARLEEDRLEPPPWQGEEPIEGPPRTWGPVPGMRRTSILDSRTEDIGLEEV